MGAAECEPAKETERAHGHVGGEVEENVSRKRTWSTAWMMLKSPVRCVLDSTVWRTTPVRKGLLGSGKQKLR